MSRPITLAPVKRLTGAGRIRQAGRSGLAVVFISHTLAHVLDVTDRVVVLRLGRVVADQRTSQLTHETLLRAIAGLN